MHPDCSLLLLMFNTFNRYFATLRLTPESDSRNSNNIVIDELIYINHINIQDFVKSAKFRGVVKIEDIADAKSDFTP